MTQLSIELARVAGERAMQACAEKAERAAPGWLDLAFAYFVRWCQLRGVGQVMMPEEVALEYRADGNFVQAHDDRSWGAVVKRAIKTGVIEYHDSRGRRLRGHGSRCDRYRITGKKPTEVL